MRTSSREKCCLGLKAAAVDAHPAPLSRQRLRSYKLGEKRRRPGCPSLKVKHYRVGASCDASLGTSLASTAPGRRQRAKLANVETPTLCVPMRAATVRAL